MHICIISDLFLGHEGISGGEYSAYILARALVERGSNVTVLTSRGKGLKGYENLDGINVHRIFNDKLGRNCPKYPLIWPLLYNELNYLDIAIKTVAFAKNHKIDIIHAVNMSEPGAVIAGKILKKPVVATINTYQITCPTGVYTVEDGNIKRCSGCSLKGLYACILRDSKYQKSLLRKLISPVTFLYSYFNLKERKFFASKLDKIIAVSPAVKEALIEGSVAKEKIEVIPNMIDERFYNYDVKKEEARKSLSLPSDKKIILYVATGATKLKGYEYLLNAVSYVAKKIPDSLFLIAGNVSEKDKELANKLKENITFMGYVPYAQMPAIFAASDIVVSPSLWQETLSRVLLEAVASGKPVVGTTVGGTSYVIQDGINGFLADPLDFADFADKVITLLKDDKLAEGMGKESKKIAKERFGADVVAGAITRLYNDCMK